MTIETIKLSDLRLSPLNVRKVKPSAIESLAADIQAHGLLQNLLAYIEDGKYQVFAGGRRYRALKHLEKTKAIKASHMVAVDVRSKDEAIELSLSENSAREAMHPADAINAYGALQTSGQSADNIAARFGVSASYVRKILKLAGLHEDLRKALAQDRLGMDAAQALTLTDDVTRQLEAYRLCSNHAHAIRRFLTTEKINTQSGLFRFVGIEAYAAAGGSITADLFAADGEGYADQPELLSDLAIAKLEAAAADYRNLGWTDVRVSLDRPHDYYSLVSLFPDATREADANEQAELDAVSAGIANRAAEIEPDDIWSDEIIREYRQRERAIEAALRHHSAEQMAAGAILLFVGHDGALEAKAIRTKKIAKDKSDGSVRPKPDYAASMIETLSRIKTQAVQEAVANDPDLALDILIDSMMAQLVDGEPSYLSPLSLACDATDTNVPDELMTLSSIGHIDDMADELVELLPQEGRFAALRAMDSSTKQRVLAWLVAKQLNGIQPANARPDIRQKRFEQIARASGVDLAGKWEAPIAFFNRLKKPIMLKIIGEELGAEAANNLAKLKKHELASVAAERLQGRGWLPAPLVIGSIDSGAKDPLEPAADTVFPRPDDCIEAEAA